MADLTMAEQASTPSTPASGSWRLYFKSDGAHYLDDAGAEIGPLGEAVAPPSVQEGRLSLSSTESVPTSDQTAKTSIYLLPHRGRRISLFNGTTWALYDLGATGVTLAPTLGASTVYDVFAYASGSTVTLEILAWSSGTARATALVAQDGILSKTGALTRRYIGTIYTNGSSQLTDAERARFVWNKDNRVDYVDWGHDGTSSWTEAGNGTFSAINSGDAAWKHEFVIGLDEEPMEASAHLTFDDAGIGTFVVALDSATTYDRTAAVWFRFGGSGTGAEFMGETKWAGRPGIGVHYLQGISTSDTYTITFFGDGAGTHTSQSGMFSRGQR